MKDHTQKDDNEEIAFDSEADGLEFVADEGEGDLELLREKLKRVRKDLSSCRAEKQEYLEGWQRARADLVNNKKWLEAERDTRSQATLERILLGLLPVLDSFDHAFSNQDRWLSVDETWRTGVEQIHKQLISILGDHKLESFSPLGEKFKPEEHEPMLTSAAKSKEEEHTVTSVLQKGYRLDGKILRPAKVAVAGDYDAH